MRDFFLTGEDRAFRDEIRDFLNRELAPRAEKIERDEDRETVKEVVRAIGEAGCMTLMVSDLHEGSLAHPGLTRATMLFEEAAHLTYAFETTTDVHIVRGVTDPDVAPQKAMTALAGLKDMRAILGGSGLGVARSAFDIATDHAQSRQAFGEKRGGKQRIWDMVAKRSWRLDAAELLTYRAAKMYDAGIRGRDPMREAAQAKLVAAETAVYCADRTVQILGGDGISRQYGRAEQNHRDARDLPIVAGSSEMATYLIAAREMPPIKPNL